MRDAGLEKCRTDLHLTSTGRAHFYKPVDTFPSPGFHQRAFDPLPAGLLKEYFRPTRRFETTSGSFHNKKEPVPELRNAIYQKAPSSRRIQYMMNNSEVIQKHHNRNFTMADRVSENADRYRPHETNRKHIVSTRGPPPFVDSMLEFRPPTDCHQSITAKDYRQYSPAEQTTKFSAKDNLTYWEAEGFPKVWGYGSVENKAIVRQKNDKPGQKMTNEFMGGNKLVSRTTCQPPRFVFDTVPFKGNRTLVQDSYVRHASAGEALPASLFFSGGKRRHGNLTDFGGYTVESDRIGSMTN